MERKNIIVCISAEDFPAFDQGQEIEQKPYHSWNLLEGDIIRWFFSETRKGIAKVASCYNIGNGEVCCFVKVSDA